GSGVRAKNAVAGVPAVVDAEIEGLDLGEGDVCRAVVDVGDASAGESLRQVVIGQRQADDPVRVGDLVVQYRLRGETGNLVGLFDQGVVHRQPETGQERGSEDQPGGPAVGLLGP